jgi:predicted ATPase
MIFLANTLWTLGDVDRARDFANESLTRFTDINAIPVAPAYISIFEAMRRDAGRAMPLAHAAVVQAREQGTPFWLALGTFVYSWAGYQMGDREIGLSNMRRSIANLRELGIGAWMPICAGLRAKAEADCNGAEIGLAILDDQLVETTRSGQRFFDAELHRLRGEFLLRHNPTRATAAEQAFVESIDIARRQQARTFELRATFSLAKHYCVTGRHRAARELLVPALVGFSEGPEFPEVGESLRLLASLDQLSGAVV